MSWFKKADFPPMPPKGPSPLPPAGGPKPPFPPKGPSEKKDVLDGKGIAKALKDLIAKEKSESGEVKLLEEALTKVEKFVEAEGKEKEKSKKEEKPEKEEKTEEKPDKDLADKLD